MYMYLPCGVLGTCSGLFSSSDLIRIQTALRREHSKKSATPQTIAKLVQHNLHVIVVWDINRTTESPINAAPDARLEEKTRDVYSMVCGQCGVVDHYEPWGQRELSEVAQRLWKEKRGSLQQGWINSGEAIAMLHVHV